MVRTVLFLSSSPLTFRLKIISSMVVRAPHGEVAKAIPVVWLATHKLCVSVDAVVGVELLATSIADKHMATVLPNFMLGRRYTGIQCHVIQESCVYTCQPHK